MRGRDLVATRPSWVVGLRLLLMGAGPRGSQDEKERERVRAPTAGSRGQGPCSSYAKLGCGAPDLPTEGGVPAASGPNWGMGPQATLVGTGFSGHQAG